jgi:hypothetical protein
MSPEEERINDALLQLIDEHGLSANDIADVIAEQVSGAKNSSSEKVKFVAGRLERKFGAKAQSSGTTANYNAKADEFGGYFLSFLLSFRNNGNMDGIATALEALENAYEIQKSMESSNNSDQTSKRYIDWHEEFGITMSSEIQDEMFDAGRAINLAGMLMSEHQDRDSILNAAEKYKLAVAKSGFIESKFLENGIKDIKPAHIATAFYLLDAAALKQKGPLSFSPQEIATAYSATLALGVGAPEEEATRISSTDTDRVELVIKWVLYHYQNKQVSLS